MYVTEKREVDQIKRVSGSVKAYRNAPGLIETAVYAALHYAISNNAPIFVIGGNSYGHSVFHLVRLNDRLDRYQPGEKEADVVMVNPNGKVFKVTVTDQVAKKS